MCIHKAVKTKWPTQLKKQNLMSNRNGTRHVHIATMRVSCEHSLLPIFAPGAMQLLRGEGSKHGFTTGRRSSKCG